MKTKLINKTLIFLTILSLQSCGVFTSVFKESNKSKESTETKVSKEIDSVVEDKSKIITIEKAEVIIDVPSKQIETNTPVLDLSLIKDLILVRDELVEVRQTYDTLTKNLKTTVYIKPLKIPVKIDRTTITNKNIVSTTSIKQDSIGKSNKIIKSEVKTKEPKNIFWFVIIISVLSVGIFFGFKYFFKKKLL